MRSRYHRWDGSQDPFSDAVDVGAVLEELGDDLLMGSGGRSAVQRMLQRGLSGQAGLAELRARLEARRRALADRLDPAGPMDDLRDQLDGIIDLERQALGGQDAEAARFDELTLDTLPRDVGGTIRELQAKESWASPEAELAFRELLDDLRKQILDSYLKDLTASMQSVTPDDVRQVTEMLADLNAMLEARERGERVDFDGFMARHGHLFPERPQDLDELLEVLARRMAAMSRLLASMSPEQRGQLEELARQLFGDLDLQFQLAQLGQNLRGLLPRMGWDEPQPGGLGAEPMPLSAAVDAMERLGELDELEEALRQDYPGASLDDVDDEALGRALDEDSVQDLRRLRQIERALEQAGVLRRSQGELELTPRGARMLGERALTQLLDRIRRETSTRAVGYDAEPTGQTRAWRFGDREPISVQRTVHNAVLRRASRAGESGQGVALHPDDFEVLEEEVRPRTATALLLDLSFSMPLRGHFVPAKRMALALHALIQGKYPQDSLHLIGFSDYARRLQPADLGAAGFERVYGTNMHHAFMLARRVLAEDRRPVKQVIMVTDGEPTAHLEEEVAVFHWPPIRETIESTLREAVRLARSAIRLNVFLLEDDPGLVAFADRLAGVTGGQVFQMSGDEMGSFILRDYVAR
ncbi:MAG TPA: hypothetical protein VGA69_06680 [Nitriliruptorales bacterium]